MVERCETKSDVYVTISGPVGSGKSAIYFEIMVALKAIGVEVIHADPDAVQSEINMGFGDTSGALELYNPRVTMAELILRQPKEQPNAE